MNRIDGENISDTINHNDIKAKVEGRKQRNQR